MAMTGGGQQGLCLPYDSFSTQFLAGHCAESHGDVPAFQKRLFATQLWLGHLYHELDLDSEPPALLQAPFLQGQAGEGHISQLPFQSKSWKSKSLDLINKIPAVMSQFTGRVDRVFF